MRIDQRLSKIRDAENTGHSSTSSFVRPVVRLTSQLVTTIYIIVHP